MSRKRKPEYTVVRAHANRKATRLIAFSIYWKRFRRLVRVLLPSEKQTRPRRCGKNRRNTHTHVFYKYIIYRLRDRNKRSDSSFSFLENRKLMELVCGPDKCVLLLRERIPFESINCYIQRECRTTATTEGGFSPHDIFCALCSLKRPVRQFANARYGLRLKSITISAY